MDQTDKLEELEDRIARLERKANFDEDDPCGQFTLWSFRAAAAAALIGLTYDDNPSNRLLHFFFLLVTLTTQYLAS